MSAIIQNKTTFKRARKDVTREYGKPYRAKKQLIMVSCKQLLIPYEAINNTYEAINNTLRSN
jgi:hypothetical protein